jgi:hypothetical protein
LSKEKTDAMVEIQWQMPYIKNRKNMKQQISEKIILIFPETFSLRLEKFF